MTGKRLFELGENIGDATETDEANFYAADYARGRRSTTCRSTGEFNR
ncbi:hypothetical protein JIM95_007245 [Corynebacterium sp. CCM 8835]|uniref:Uncharacterized protein n=1 Tax=Corynebacterium antarcticum TaxID=2800405 RepID=A0ABS1FIJ2_9CORY|nr:hypothetical protein [Corynebacterium antarcticum]MCL0245934.1 hypothetical protein [Corynebacterium antarcticum]MCX7540508.1 hypothetical protein [Corynebacterium antarcticum]